MKKIWTAGLLMMLCGQLHAASYQCYIAPMCATMSNPDSSCDKICESSSCPSGKPALPAGYTGGFIRGVVTTCNNNNTYSCSCGVATSGTLSCASGYTGTAKYQYINGTDNFTGCYKNGGDISCNVGYYKLGSSCAPCPSQDGVSGTSSFGATSIYACFITKNTKLKDTSGTYEFSNNCYYTSDSGGLIPLPDEPIVPIL